MSVSQRQAIPIYLRDLDRNGRVERPSRIADKLRPRTYAFVSDDSDEDCAGVNGLVSGSRHDARLHDVGWSCAYRRKRASEGAKGDRFPGRKFAPLTSK